jgi:hypothetical protein
MTVLLFPIICFHGLSFLVVPHHGETTLEINLYTVQVLLCFAFVGNR